MSADPRSAPTHCVGADVKSRQTLALPALAGHIVSTLGRQLLSSALGLATAAVVARSCGPIGNGALAVALLLPNLLAALLNLGLIPATVYLLGSSQLTIQAWLRHCTVVYVVVACVGVAVGALIVSLLSKALFPGVEQPLLWLALATFPTGFLASLLMAAHQGLHRFRDVNSTLVCQSLLQLIAVSTMALLGQADVESVLVTQIATQITACAWMAIRLWPEVRQTSDSRSTGRYGHSLIGYGARAHLGNIVAFLNYRTDAFMLNLIAGPSQTGVYSVAASMGERLSLIPQAVGFNLFPRLAQFAGREAEQGVLTAIVARWVLAITTALAIPFSLAATFLVPVVFGAEYQAAIEPLLIMMPGYVLSALSQTLANDIAARGKPELNAATGTLALLLNVVANLLLIPWLGVNGAALSTTLSLAANALMKIVVFRAHSRADWAACLIPSRLDFALIRSALMSRSPFNRDTP
jgi:O-antigen/teichoic acid export membrane protein